MSKNLELWIEFKNELMYQNRFFHKTDQKFQMIHTFLDKLIFSSGLYEKDIVFYRARIGRFEKEEDIKNPDPQKVVINNGRCNPNGVSYLYVSRNLETCLNEVVPEVNDVITVGYYETIGSIHYADFEIARKAQQEMRGLPSFTDDENELYDLLMNDLSKPLNSREKIEYIPIQYITEYVKYSHKNLDAFSFNSSYDGFQNFVFFCS